MGTNSPPFMDETVRLSDWLVSDGAQVDGPSIDPYREGVGTPPLSEGPA